MKRELTSEPDLRLLAAWDLENKCKDMNQVASSSTNGVSCRASSVPISASSA